jgi:magnesium-transporting ATPase (P-type)
MKMRIEPLVRRCRCGRRVTHHHLYCDKCWRKRQTITHTLFMDTRGQGFPSFNIFYWMIISFLVVAFFAGLIYAMGLINGVMHQVGVENDKNVGSPLWVNLTQASDETFGQVNNSIQALRMVSIVYILGLAVTIIVANALMKIHPIYFFAYIIICLLAVIFAVPIANAYEGLMNSGIYNGLLTSFTASNWILLNLPILTLFISVLGGVLLFVNLVRTGNEGSGL